MMIFDLLFIIFILAGLVTLVLAASAGLRGRSRQAYALLRRYAWVCLIYMATLLVVSLVSPQHIVPMNDDCCFDDWCVAVEEVIFLSEIDHVDSPVKANGIFYIVQLRISNQARGRSQRASSAAVYLLEEDGQQFEVSEQGQAAFEAKYGAQPPLTVTLPVGSSVHTVRVFDLPKDSREVGLIIRHPVGFSPGLLIIGDQASLFHKRTIIHLK